MAMTDATLHIYEALADAGIEPSKARKIERAILFDVSENQSKMEKTLLDRLMTKEDGHQLRSDMLARMNEQIRWHVGLTLAAVTASTAVSITALKLFL
ncbi:MAG: hypothetical protein LBE50_06970 [Gallionellaceae bacterium]|jgi:hypothetical protein|nr:hypothetical protein [Gallionellaceae bacterium]